MIRGNGDVEGLEDGVLGDNRAGPGGEKGDGAFLQGKVWFGHGSWLGGIGFAGMAFGRGLGVGGGRCPSGASVGVGDRGGSRVDGLALLGGTGFLRETISAQRSWTVEVRLVMMVISDLFSDRRKAMSEDWVSNLAFMAINNLVCWRKPLSTATWMAMGSKGLTMKSSSLSLSLF